MSEESAFQRLGRYVRFTRPFTLLPPLLGVVSGAITAWGSAANPHVLAGEARQVTWSIVWTVALGSLCAGLLNAASNAINQYYDVENDRINKPHRPLVQPGAARSVSDHESPDWPMLEERQGFH